MANNHDVLRVRHQYNVNQNRRNRDGAAKSVDLFMDKKYILQNSDRIVS